MVKLKEKKTEGKNKTQSIQKKIENKNEIPIIIQGICVYKQIATIIEVYISCLFCERQREETKRGGQERWQNHIVTGAISRKMLFKPSTIHGYIV